MSKENMFVKVIAASEHSSANVKPIYTIHARYPRCIHSEIMTHRVFSRNARSSRAVPIKTMLKEIEQNPFVPWHWGKNQPGMQALEECDELIFINTDDDVSLSTREEAWRASMATTLIVAKAFDNAGYHKQIVNRLLEPFMWIDTLITSTEWDNFFELRCHTDAEPHLQDLARMIKKAIQEAPLSKLNTGQWHLPYISEQEKDTYDTDTLIKLSAARCARISYKPFNGQDSLEAELIRFDKLVNSKPIHASPIEHQAMVDIVSLLSEDKLKSNFCNGWLQYRSLFEKGTNLL